MSLHRDTSCAAELRASGLRLEERAAAELRLVAGANNELTLRRDGKVVLSRELGPGTCAEVSRAAVVIVERWGAQLAPVPVTRKLGGAAMTGIVARDTGLGVEARDGGAMLLGSGGGPRDGGVTRVDVDAGVSVSSTASANASPRVDAGVGVSREVALNEPTRVDAGVGTSREARVDAGVGVSREARVDAGVGVSREARVDAGVGASRDARVDAGVGVIGAGVGASRDARVDAGVGVSREVSVNEPTRVGAGVGASRDARVDAGVGVSREVAPNEPTRVDAGVDASREARVAVGVGASRDARVDAGVGVSREVSLNEPTRVDAGVGASPEARVDAGVGVSREVALNEPARVDAGVGVSREVSLNEPTRVDAGVVVSREVSLNETPPVATDEVDPLLRAIGTAPTLPAEDGGVASSERVVAAPPLRVEVTHLEAFLGAGLVTPAFTEPVGPALAAELALVLNHRVRLGLLGLFDFGGSTAVLDESLRSRGTFTTRGGAILPRADVCFGLALRVCGGVLVGAHLDEGTAQGDFLYGEKTARTGAFVFGPALQAAWLPGSFHLALDAALLVSPAPSTFELTGFSSRFSVPPLQGLIRLSVGLGTSR
ncbi:MAG: hypothetical protein ACOZQL_15415 [Myxococcota bacterium]